MRSRSFDLEPFSSGSGTSVIFFYQLRCSVSSKEVRFRYLLSDNVLVKLHPDVSNLLIKICNFFQNLTPNCHYVPIRRKFIFRIFTTLVNALRKDFLIDELFEIGHQRIRNRLISYSFPSFEKSAAEML